MNRTIVRRVDDRTVIVTRPRGPMGLPGADGPPGADGKSAYQLALDTGYVGTLADWMEEIADASLARAGAQTAAADADADRIAADAARVAAQTAATNAGIAKSAAEAARDLTLTTAAAAASNFLAMSSLHPDTAAGLAATAEGGYFGVAQAGDLAVSIYREVSGAAVFVNYLPSRAMLERVGYPVQIVPGADNSIAINAALANPLIQTVLLPPGDITCSQCIVVPTGKALRGAGMNVTILIYPPTLPLVLGIGYGCVFSLNTTGVRISDFTVVAPKTGTQPQGIWMRGAKNFIVENIETRNAHYAFWAQENAQFGTFRNIRSRNSNVDFECTTAFDIVFDGMYADDGDNDNPAGKEGVWHPLFGSKRITYRNGIHYGKGQPFLVVANVGAGDAGLIDDIRFENCRSVMSEGKIGFFVSKINASASVGKIYATDCEWTLPTGGIPMQVQLGEVYLKGGRVRHSSQEGFIAYPTAVIDWTDPDVYTNSAVGATGYHFGGDGTIRVRGGRLETVQPIITPGDAKNNNVRVSPETVVVNPAIEGLERPGTIGRSYSYTYATDQTGNDPTFGVPNAEKKFQFSTIAGERYRMRARGVIRANSIPNLRVYMEPAVGAVFGTASGYIRIEKADGTHHTVPIRKSPAIIAQVDDAVAGDKRDFEADVEFTGLGNTAQLLFGASDTTILAGCTVSVERIG